MQKNIQAHWLLPAVINQSKIILETYYKIKGVALFDTGYSDEYKSYLLYHAPFVVVSHGIEADPVFNYANMTAQQLWRIDWEDFVKLPSKYSAEPGSTEDRQQLLDTAERQGYVDHFRGTRISSQGNRFVIENVLLCNLTDGAGQRIGQAALFRSWTDV
ncbi:MAG: MEKHLA domain-containing protein [Cytophaga sp.]|uniref:MEKHLA domain-containing protein n=1 Tax=Cytophaga sp. TaxID=29535 RepID=UPI003F7F7510